MGALKHTWATMLRPNILFRGFWTVSIAEQIILQPCKLLKFTSRVEVANYFSFKEDVERKVYSADLFFKENLYLISMVKTVFYCGSEVVQGHPLLRFFLAFSIV